jgi:hypothetical protein
VYEGFLPVFSQSRRPAGSSRKQRACHSFRCEAGPLAALVKIAGPLQAALPIIMTMAAPAAALLV